LQAAEHSVLPSTGRLFLAPAERQLIIEDADEAVVAVKSGAPFLETAVLNGSDARAGIIRVLAVNRFRERIETAEICAPRQPPLHFHRCRMERRVAEVGAHQHITELREWAVVLRRGENLVLQRRIPCSEIDRESVVLPALDQS